MNPFFLDSASLDRVCGLRPEVWLNVGSGYAREDVKSLILSSGKGFVGEAVVTLQDLCLKLTGFDRTRVLSSFSRQEVLRELLSEPRILAAMPELKRIRRQRSFLRRLDAALQMGRMAFAHEQEEEVYEERLTQVLGPNLLRKELRALTHAYEAWLGASGYADVPLLIRAALKVLESGWPVQLPRPQEIWSLSIQTPESLEREFWEVLGQSITIRQSQSESKKETSQEPLKIDWQSWHTLDHAAESWADELLEKSQNIDGPGVDEATSQESPDESASPNWVNSPNWPNWPNWKDHAILIPDVPMIRRSLRRVLESRGIPLADPRDPTRLRWDESIKWALLPLEVIGRNFERARVISWFRGYQMRKEFSDWVVEINARGIRNGLLSYSGGGLVEAFLLLQDLERQLGGKKTCEEMAKTHLKILGDQIGSDTDRFWITSFFENLWKEFSADRARIGQEHKKAPALFWLERLQARLSEASPPVERVKPRGGIQIYRLQQAPLHPVKKVWILGMPSLWLEGQGSGTYWFNERERELLSTEFAVRSSIQIREERLGVLKAWILGAEEVTFLDCHYDVDGRERESIAPILKELQKLTQANVPDAPIDRGAHPRFLKSYSMVRSIQPQEVLFSKPRPWKGKSFRELSATAVDRYSRCPFQALVYHRWNLRDIREPDSELWPDIRGNLLHEAVRLLMSSLNADRQFTLSPRESLEKAWATRKPKGLIKSRRIEAYVQSRMCLVLEAFCEIEQEYLKRAGTQPLSLDSESFRMEYPDFSITGQPDRIDEHAEGLFILDYKTSGTVPHGVDMVDLGYRLQLPFYALAVQQTMRKPVLGVQFVELDRKGSRRSGIFFKCHNGKDPGRLTQVRSNSKSLMILEPEEVWSTLKTHLIESAQGLLGGRFDARPKLENREKECKRCSVSDLCGFRRQLENDPLGESAR